VGIVAALGAGVLLGTMYIPYRKAYISGMNPLSFVTIFTFGELGTVFFSQPSISAVSAASSRNSSVRAPCSSGRSSAASAGYRRLVPTVRGEVYRLGRGIRSPTPTSLGIGVGRIGLRRMAALNPPEDC